MLDSQFPPGTPVCIRQCIVLHDQDLETETIGVIEAWEELPTGSWYAYGKNDQLWLRRLRVRKADGEITLLVVDGRTSIAELEARTPEPE